VFKLNNASRHLHQPIYTAIKQFLEHNIKIYNMKNSLYIDCIKMYLFCYSAFFMG